MKNILKITLIILLSSLVSLSFAQTIDLDNEEEDDTIENKEDNTIDNDYACIFYIEYWPEFPGGDSARLNFLTENIKYPKIAKHKKIEGTVYVTFVVEKDGSITNIKLLRGVCSSIDAEVIRVMKLMPKWKPQLYRNKTVRTSMIMPFKFSLDKTHKETLKGI